MTGVDPAIFATSVEEQAVSFVEDVHAENQKFYSSDLGHAALKDLQQTFPHRWLYVGELLQNAVDAGATRIRLEAVPEGLLFEHDGAPFAPENVRALCARGLSTKGAGTVGFMGIGFKAVFQSFQQVAISSGPWHFGFEVKEDVGEYGERLRDWLGCVLPRNIDAQPPSGGMQCRFLLKDRLSHLGPVHDDVVNVLSSDLVVLALLAQRGVKELAWNSQRWTLGKTTVSVDEQTTRLLLEATDVQSGQRREWVLFSAKYQPSRDAIARFLEHRQKGRSPEVYAEAARERSVDVFCPLGAGVPVPPKRGYAYALLATGVSVPLGLHVQADWLLNTSRRELMDVDTNEWHQEILGRLAGLLRSYLSWVAGLQLPDDSLAGAYAVLPAWSEANGDFGGFVQSDNFRNSLRAALADLSFLPVRTSEGATFRSPSEARLLPVSLREFDRKNLFSWVLFGEQIISTNLLGTATQKSIEALGLLRQITPAELVVHWNKGVLRSWREQLGTTAPESHLKLLRALASLDDTPGWRDAPLACLPTADGGWIDRYHAVGLPADWDSIPEQDPPLRSWLEAYLAPQATRPDWMFDRGVQRDPLAREFLAGLNRDALDDVMERWWKSLPAAPDEKTAVKALDVTCWVRTKQRGRPGLVKRVLCNNAGTLVLAGFSDAVLAAPYANASRAFFYPQQYPVNERYLNHQAGASEADWRSFFEAASTNIAGPFRLVRSINELSYRRAQQELPDCKLPATKTVAIYKNWEGVRFSSDNYLLVDNALPGVLNDVLAGNITPEMSGHIVQWLDEARQTLGGDAKKYLIYVGYNSSTVYRNITTYAASWVAALQGKWWYATDGTGPHVPEALLSAIDPARPETPVVDAPAELVTTLVNCGLCFGEDVPDVLSVERLGREGPSATIERVVELLAQALKDTIGDDDGQHALQMVLRSSPLIPVPAGTVLIDGVSRVSAERLVLSGSRGAELGRWLLPIEDIGKQSEYDRLLDLVTVIHKVPTGPTGAQALAFLKWVWQTKPDAEAVRRILPRLYRLVTEEVQSDNLPTWEDARKEAFVYIAGRQWVSVTADDLYLDDLGEDRLKNYAGALQLATPGHLGDTADEQRSIAELLDMKLLSSRFTIDLQPTGQLGLPAEWEEQLQAIIALAYAFQDEESDDARPASMPDFAYFEQLQKTLLDEGVAAHSWSVRAARDDVRILLSGEPREFMADLCRVLLQWTGLAGRRDLDELAPAISQLIVYLGLPEAFAQRMAETRIQHGLAKPLPPATPDEESTPAAGAEAPKPEDAPKHVGPADQPKTDPPTTSALGGETPLSEPAGDNDESEEDANEEMDEKPMPPPPSHGWTPGDRERRLDALRKREAEVQAQMKELLGTGPLPPEEPDKQAGEEGTKKEFASDTAYRDAVIAYEGKHDRYAEAKDAGQPGYDVDSFDEPPQDPSRLLVRRIEVKGFGTDWTDDNIVELSDRQFFDAVDKRVDGVAVAAEFDYWLYVVERQADGKLHVLPIKNPSRRAAKFEFRGGTWRALAEEETVGGK